MSGQPGNGGSPSINRPNKNDNCENIVINTILASPQADVIGGLSTGDILTISMASDQGPLQAFDENGNLAGNILSREQIRLMNCIAQGVNYLAEVKSIEDGECHIQIFAE